MSILMVLSCLLSFVAGIVVGKCLDFLYKKGKENKDAVVKASKHEDIVDNQEINTQDNNIEEEKEQEIDNKATWIKRKNIAAWDENYPLNVSWKYECSNCWFEVRERVERCPHCKYIMS